jgi:hypothetical protein
MQDNTTAGFVEAKHDKERTGQGEGQCIYQRKMQAKVTTKQ